MSVPPGGLVAALAERYRIERELGSGGMATVYLAEDVRHRRKVGVKVLHPELSAVLGVERFLKEIELTANLQHPHILPLFDSGEAAGQLFYVMPFVEGETLRSCLERTRQLPIPEALRIAREVADALAYAHSRGVIHRDIKPENILLQGGHALVADFGIALAVQQAGGSRMTQTGLSLGTPQYMSPEQAMGEKAIDARTDVYALGAVLYETLTGDPPFTGSTVQAIVAKVMTERPASIRTTRDTVPPNVEAAVMTALAKLPADRFEGAREFLAALDDSRFAPTISIESPSARAVATRTSRLPLAISAAIALVSLGVAAWALTRGERSAPQAMVQAIIETPNGNPDLGRFGVSPNGDRFAFCTDEGIALRDSAQREYRMLPSTERCESPVFGPDGRWIAYQADGKVSKVPVAGGTPVRIPIPDSISASRVTWGADGTLAFESGDRIGVIGADGVTRMLRNAVGGAPRLTLDGKGLFYVDTRSGSRLKYYNLASDSVTEVVTDASEGQLLPSGKIVYCSSLGGLYVMSFDARTHKATGSPTPVALDVQPNGTWAPFVITSNGTLVYRAGKDPEMRVVIRAPSGKTDTLPLAPRTLGYVRFSPDGKLLALTVGSARGTNRHTAFYDFARNTLTRFTMDGGGHSPVWSPDGTQLAYTREGPGTDAEDIAIQPVDGSKQPRLMQAMPNDQHSTSWPNDSTLVFTSNGAPRSLGGTLGGGTTFVIDPRTGKAPRAYLTAPYGESEAVVSPDGQWIAYTSRESGRNEIQVRRFTMPQPTGKWLVSSTGGQRARWAPDGRTIYFVNDEGTAIEAVDVKSGPEFSVGPARLVMKVEVVGQAWDIDRATGRIAVAEPVVSAGVRIVIQQGWLADMEQRLARDRGR